MHSVLIALALGQLDFQAPPPPALERPSLVPYALFENPLPLAALLVAVAIISAYMLNRRGRARAGVFASVVSFAGAAAVVAAAMLVTTPRETAMARTVELVAAVARIDEPGLRRLLADDARFVVSEPMPEVSAAPPGLDRERTIDLVRSTLRRYPVREHHTRSVSAEVRRGNTILSQCRVRVVVEGYEFAHNSWWRILWRVQPDGDCRAIEVRPYSLDMVGVVGR
jgi:hypothetical protein